MSAEWWPVHNGVAGSAMPAGVPSAAVAEAGDVTHQDLVRAERVTLRAAAGRLCHPLAVGRSD
jgi:hypothetical protein